MSFANSAEGDSEVFEKFIIKTEAPNNKQLEVAYRAPKISEDNKYSPAILVMFGGRNWKAAKTFRTYKFNQLADKYNVYLVSPSFKDDEYWHPEKWSGEALFEAIDRLKTKFNLNEPDLYYYGYSAGGQCANLFYFYKPESICAVGIHACGVFSAALTKPSAPFLVTCSENDDIRFQLSYTFAQKLREQTVSADIPLSKVIFKNYQAGHELNEEALILARCFFSDMLEKREQVKFIAEDFINTIYDADSARSANIDKELKNIFYSRKTADAWLEPITRGE